MGVNDRMIFQTPGPEAMFVTKQPVQGRQCPACRSSEIARYPVGHYLGPRIVTKCQACYHSLEVDVPSEADNWPPFRALSYDWDASPAERASQAG